MKAAFLRGPRQLEIEEIELPDAGNQVEVTVLACGICGSDLHGWEHPELSVGIKGGPAPGFTGHEIAVTYTDPKTGAKTLATIEPNRLTACGSCEACRGRSAWFCRNRSGLEAFGYAEAMVVPPWSLFPLPAGTNPVLATLVEPLACAVHTIRSSHSARNDGRIDGLSVAVLGAGVTGILTAAAARYLGATEVTVTARHPHQADQALQMGANTVLEADDDDTLASLREVQPHLVVECVGGTAPTLALALRAVTAGGEVAAFGLFDEPQQIDTRRASMKELRMFFPITYGTIDGVHDFEVAIEMLTTTDLPFGSLVTHEFPLDDISAAFEAAADKRSGALRVVVKP
ncbi:MAG: zinc-binding dehydrogenase [bacterium]|nr:zinc-binding dehydrogenase [bacterium]